MPRVTRRMVSVDGSERPVLRGGAGTTLVLIHGGWGGAALHYSRVFEALAETFDVVAPELPGFLESDARVPRGVDGDAEWVAALLDSLGVEKAIVVGNSFGASVALAFASRHRSRCLGVVVVNGFAMPPTPAWLAFLARARFARALLREFIVRTAFRPARIAEAFHDPRNVPPELHATIAAGARAQVDRLVDTFLLGGSPIDLAGVPTRILWGADDQLRDSRVEVAPRVARELGVSAPRTIAGAGHCPQLEQPEAFVREIRAFASGL